MVMGVLYCLLFVAFVVLAIFMLVTTLRSDDARDDSEVELHLMERNRRDGRDAATSGHGAPIPDRRVTHGGDNTSRPTPPATTTRSRRPSRRWNTCPRNSRRTTKTFRPPEVPSTTTFSPGGVRVAVEMIESSLNWSHAPCNDFYKFVCSNFKGAPNVLDKMTNHTDQAARRMLATIHVPLAGQTPTEKAAGLYRACVQLGSSPLNSEVHLLKSFFSDLGLDFADTSNDPNFDMLNRIVRLNFEFGLQPFVMFGLFRNVPRIAKYTLFMRITKEDQDWMRDKHHFVNDTFRAELYQGILRVYDTSLDWARIVARIVIGETAVLDLMDDLKEEKFPETMTTVEELGNYTQKIISKDVAYPPSTPPSTTNIHNVSSHYKTTQQTNEKALLSTSTSQLFNPHNPPVPRLDQWVWAIQHFTRRAFTAQDNVMLFDKAPALVGLMMNSARLARYDARVLLAWGLFRRLLPLAHGEWMRKHVAADQRVGLSMEDHCFETISGIMSMAVTHHYMKTFVPPRVVNSARHVVNDLKETLAEKLNNTPWIQNPVRDMVLKRVTDLWIDMAYPDDYANDALVEGFYARFPDVGAYFIPSYIASLRELTIRTFRGHVEARFKAAEANAWYNMEENSVRVCAGVLQPPVYILDAPAALNYGGLGQVVGHEMMHAYDVRNMARDELMKPINFSETQTMKLYEEKVLCLRNSYIKQEGASRARTLDHKLDSEGLVDYVGLLLAHAAFQKLPAKDRDEALPGVGLSAQQLFYVAHCRKWCAPPQSRYFRLRADLYWPRRSRCVVPLQNMPEFAETFDCKPGDVMNAEERCPFW
ncbi:uncharacterized protein LOC144134505 [Amblyomma americanum]